MKPPADSADAYNDDCVRCSMAAILELPLAKVKRIPPNDGLSTNGFWRQWSKEAKAHGYRLREKWYDELVPLRHLIPPRGYWIAIVPSIVEPAPATHAIVMKGRKLVYDCCEKPRKRAPRKIYARLTLERLHAD